MMATENKIELHRSNETASLKCSVLLQCEAALRQAKSHVVRQQHGRHEQDREDAVQWLKDWSPLIEELALLVPLLQEKEGE
tara:strand:+ start:598 stop:840 length:243 start_codon:yes stop_codon:yes gene_type:complete